jgi:hypothetical protein
MAGNPETPPPKDWAGKAPEPAPNKKNSDEVVVTLMTTAQQNMTALKTTQTEDECLRARHEPALAVRATLCTYGTCLIPLLL